jgi:hypothetical protein
VAKSVTMRSSVMSESVPPLAVRTCRSSCTLSILANTSNVGMRRTADRIRLLLSDMFAFGMNLLFMRTGPSALHEHPGRWVNDGVAAHIHTNGTVKKEKAQGRGIRAKHDVSGITKRPPLGMVMKAYWQNRSAAAGFAVLRFCSPIDLTIWASNLDSLGSNPATNVPQRYYQTI